MSNELAKLSPSQTPTAPRSAYGRFAEQRAAPSFVGQLLRFNKQGEWIYGQDKKELADGTTLVAGMFTLKTGWVKWVDGNPAKQVMGLVEEEFNPPPREELGDLDESEWETMGEGRGAVPRDPWQETCTIVLADPDSKDLYTFSANSKGGRDALMVLAEEYDEHLRQSPNEIPLVALKSTSYKHKVYGKIFKPEFKIEDWIDRNEVSLTAEPEEKEEPVAAAPSRKVMKVTPVAGKKGNGKRSSRF